MARIGTETYPDRGRIMPPAAIMAAWAGLAAWTSPAAWAALALTAGLLAGKRR
jgi:hypothetical protein